MNQLEQQVGVNSISSEYFENGGAYYKCSLCNIITYSELPICKVVCLHCKSSKIYLKKINENFKL